MTARTVVIGTAGHIDHGKTTLLRALTGIDADRLPEERRRGMTIDVGYAHLDLPDGTSLDFVDVPGHDKLVGNMLVGAGEIDAAMLVVAADDGPRAQTLEHLELLDALAIRHGIAVITKIDAAPPERVAAVRETVEGLLAETTLAGAPVFAASSTTGDGIDAVRDALIDLRGRALEDHPVGRPRLAIDRVFAVKGRGTVVTGTLRGGSVAQGDVLRLAPDARELRVREVQVHGGTVERADGGRTALLLAGLDHEEVHRGQVVAAGDHPVVTSRILVTIRPARDLRSGGTAEPPANGERRRLHVGTDQTGVLVVRSPREAADLGDGAALAILRLERPIATWPLERFALRDPSGAYRAHGGVVLDPSPPRGVSRRRATPDRLRSLADATNEAAADTARLELHGLVGSQLATDVHDAVASAALEEVRAHHAADPSSTGLSATAVRAAAARTLRRSVTVTADRADIVATAVIVAVVRDGALARDGDRLRDASRAAGLPSAVREAMDRLEAALATPSPPSLSDAARAAGCPPDGVHALEAERRIVRLEDDLAWSAATYKDLARTAVTMAAAGPLTPAAFRDATGSSRKYVMAILEDLDRRELLRRTDVGHVLGRRSLAKARPATPAVP